MWHSWYSTSNDFHVHCQLKEAEHRAVPSFLIIPDAPRGAGICPYCLEDCPVLQPIAESDIHKKVLTWSLCRLNSVVTTDRKAHNLHVTGVAESSCFTAGWRNDAAVCVVAPWRVYFHK